jgi:hypothetical protein
MTITRLLCGAAAILSLAACAAGNGTPPGAQAAMDAFDKMPDTPGDGPYPALMEVDPALPGYVIYRPAQLGPLAGGRLGVFVWGNGGCVDDGASSRLHLAQIASYGYLVIAPGKWRSGPGARDPQTPPRAPGADGVLPPPPTSAADLTRALDWALVENARPGSRYAGLIDPRALAAGGFSCGGVQALEIAGDRRLRTVVVQNSGIFNEAAPPIAGMTLRKEALAALHTPVIYIQGGPEDIAYANGMDDFSRINHVPAVMANLPVGHGGTYNQPLGGKAARIAVDWLQWQLRGDPVAAAAFTGPDCRWCRDSEVTLERKNLQ